MTRRFSLPMYYMKLMTLYETDFARESEENFDCSNDGTWAYTLTDTLDDREKIHFCDISWDLGSAADVDCDSLDPFPSVEMDAFSRVALHEMMHYSTVGPETSLGLQIVDTKNLDGQFAYDPERVHGLVDEDQDDNPGLTEINADSYAWMALDSWISRKCADDATNDQWALFFTEDPPNYESED